MPVFAAQAQADPPNVDTGPGIDRIGANLDFFASNTGFEKTDLKVTIANIVNIVLGFLGIIAVIMMVVAGYQWVMSGGNEDTVKQARGRIINALIGLAITLMAYIIVNFAVTQLSGATGVGGGDGNAPPQNTNPAFNCPPGATCT